MPHNRNDLFQALAMLGLALLVGIAVLAADSAFSKARATAAAAPLLERGQTYVFIWSCLPRDVGCYGEVVRVEAVREDGWVDVVSCREAAPGQMSCETGDRWRSNLANVLSIQRFSVGKAAN